MRGKVKTAKLRRRMTGITPAYAGKRISGSRTHRHSRDHPRVCGEKWGGVLKDAARKGSPPRMRGKVCFLGLVSSFVWDHPRVCGEKTNTLCLSTNRCGSPPRMRGKACRLCPLPRRTGITPAYAGKRLKRSHRIGHFSCILCLFHSVLHRASASGGSRAGPCAPPCLPAQNAVPV